MCLILKQLVELDYFLGRGEAEYASVARIEIRHTVNEFRQFMAQPLDEP